MKPVDKIEQKERGIGGVIQGETIYTTFTLKRIGKDEWVRVEHKIEIENDENNTKT